MKITLDIPAIARALPLLHAHARALADAAGFDASRGAAIELACEEAFGLILARVAGAAQAPIRVQSELTQLSLDIAFDDREIPPLPLGDFDAQAQASVESFDLGIAAHRLIRGVADEAHWQPLGRRGNRLKLVFHRVVPGSAVDNSAGDLAQFTADEPLAPAQEYTVRLAGTDPAVDDWSQIARAMYRAYGFSYLRDDFYIPARIRELNEEGFVRSIVAVTATGEVVGHYALELTGFGQLGVTRCATGEIGRTVVHPAHRSRGLMERMRSFTEDLARQEGLLAVFSEPLMAHPFSQRANERLGARACGVFFGIAAAGLEFKAIKDDGPALRTSVLLYFQPLVPPPTRYVHFPAQHAQMLRKTYTGAGIPFVEEPARAPTGSSEVSACFHAGGDYGVIDVHSIGADIALKLRAARDDLVRGAGARVIELGFRLDDPACGMACEIAARLGFFYAGLAPHFDQGHDVLRLQLVDAAYGFDELVVAGAFAREITDYAEADRKRVEQAMAA